MTKNHWANIKEVTFVLGIRILLWIRIVFGKWPFRMILYPVLLWYFITNPLARQSSFEYLDKISRCSQNSYPRPTLKKVFSHFISFAESILDKLLVWSGEFPFDTVKIYGQETIESHIQAKEGCLLICAHMGNLELCKAISRKQNNLKITMLMHTRHAESFNELLRQISPDSQFNILQVTEMSSATILVLSEKIKNGEFIIIAGDRIPVSENPRTVEATFLGENAYFPIGPYVLASLLKCPVYLMFSITQKGSNEIYFEAFRNLISMPQRSQRQEFFKELATDYAISLQKYCMKAPLQWFNFYRFWEKP